MIGSIILINIGENGLEFSEKLAPPEFVVFYLKVYYLNIDEFKNLFYQLKSNLDDCKVNEFFKISFWILLNIEFFDWAV